MTERRRCSYNGGVVCDEECFLIGQFNSQASMGGADNKELDLSTKEVGPYWSKENWIGLVKNTLEESKKGCPHRKDLESIILETTRSKYEKGEIVEDTSGEVIP